MPGKLNGALGRMILVAREAGDLAKQEDGRPTEVSSATTLSDLGISRDLAAYAVQVAMSSSR